jgi:hypothetical protein
MTMALFKRRREAAEDEGPGPTDEDGRSASDAGPAGSGPYDGADHPGKDGLADFGAIRLPLDRDSKVTVEVSRETGQPVSVVVTKDGSRMQLTAFAAPRSAGIWEDALREQQSALAKQGGSSKEREGRFGPELLAQVPTTTSQGRQGKQMLRFIGADGPRWMLRGVIGGKAARDDEAAAALEDLFSRIVVVRGTQAMPPRALLPLTLPTLSAAASDAGDKGEDDPVALLKRGPEITEVR